MGVQRTQMMPKRRSAIPVATRERRTFMGHVFRSRSEARMAGYLYGFGFAYEYEPTVALGDENYRPDFHVLGTDRYIEMKAIRRVARMVRGPAGTRQPSWRPGYVTAFQRQKMARIERLWAKYGPGQLEIWTCHHDQLVFVETIQGAKPC